MSESKELVLVTLPAAAELEAAFISDDYINRLISDIRQKATSVVGDVNTVISSGCRHRSRGLNVAIAEGLISAAGLNNPCPLSFAYR